LLVWSIAKTKSTRGGLCSVSGVLWMFCLQCSNCWHF
jgi:hypothetical protein